MRVSDSPTACAIVLRRWSKASTSPFSTARRSIADFKYSVNECPWPSSRADSRRILFARRACCGEFLGRDPRQLFHARERGFGLLHLRAARSELGNLRIHGPDHLVQARRFDDGVLDRVLLRLQRLGLVRHVFGKRVQRGKALLGALAQFLELGERLELALHIAHRLRRGLRVGVRGARAALNALHLLAQPRLRDAQAFEFGLARGDAFDGVRDIAGGLTQLRTQRVELFALQAQAAQGRLRFARLRRHRVDDASMLLQVPAGRGERLGDALRLRHLLEQLAHALGELVEGFDALVVTGGHAGELFDLLRHAVGLAAHVVEHLARAHQLGRDAARLRQHRAQRSALFAGIVDQGAQLVIDLLAVPGGLENGVEHGGPPVRMLSSACSACRLANRQAWSCVN